MGQVIRAAPKDRAAATATGDRDGCDIHERHREQQKQREQLVSTNTECGIPDQRNRVDGEQRTDQVAAGIAQIDPRGRDIEEEHARQRPDEQHPAEVRAIRHQKKTDGDGERHANEQTVHVVHVVARVHNQQEDQDRDANVAPENQRPDQGGSRLERQLDDRLVFQEVVEQSDDEKQQHDRCGPHCLRRPERRNPNNYAKRQSGPTNEGDSAVPEPIATVLCDQPHLPRRIPEEIDGKPGGDGRHERDRGKRAHRELNISESQHGLTGWKAQGSLPALPRLAGRWSLSAMTSENSPPAIAPDAIDQDAEKVIRRLQRNGYLAYLVGGCVRDLLIGVKPKDFDLATSARPRQIQKLFRNSRIIGRRFRLAHIRFGEKVLEVATFRAPPETEDTDDPYIKRDNVWGSEESDAFRRDFTINALFYDPVKRRVIDHVGGLPDLETRTLRTIGDAEIRLREDPVRALRAAKFAARLGFTPDEELEAALRTTAGDLAKASPARILEELFRLMCGIGARRAFELLTEWDCLPVLLPELAPFPEYVLTALERIEEITRGSRTGISQGLLAAVLFAPIARAALEERPAGSDHEAEVLIGESIREISLRMTLARRDSTLARQCLGAQVRFMEAPTRRGSRRFCYRAYFRDATVLHDLIGPLAPSEDGTTDAFDQWKTLAKEVGAEDAPPSEADDGPKRQRRGRRRRGGRGRGPKADA
jgi:poly(A) polymerase